MKTFFVLLLAVLFFGCTADTQTEIEFEVENMREIVVESNSFENGEEIPSKYTCQGEDLNPHLKWSAVEEAKSYALLVDDPDAPMGTWVHWRIVNIPLKKTELEEGETAGEEIKNSFGGTAYGGPCPPSGRHRYYFKIFALDAELEGVTAENFNKKIAEHAIANGEILGYYAKK